MSKDKRFLTKAFNHELLVSDKSHDYKECYYESFDVYIVGKCIATGLNTRSVRDLINALKLREK
jgi:hypothetical protein